jgi:uncharacterized membrane protein YoaK (UPF0700 family)
MPSARQRHHLVLQLRHARRMVTTRRSETADRRLAQILTCIAGSLNAGAFLLVGQYTSHMTGIVSSVADNLVIGAGWASAAGAGALMAFTVGAAASAMLINWYRRQGSRTPYAAPLLLEAVLLAAFGLAGAVLPSSPTLLAIGIPLFCFLMGLQNATITKVSGARMRTTHMTGIVTDIGIELGKLTYWNRGGDVAASLVLADRAKLLLLASLLSCFFAGGVAGAVAFSWLGAAATLPVATLMAALAFAPAVEAKFVRQRFSNRGIRHEN